MEVYIEKSKLVDMDLIKGLRWELEGVQKELRGLQAGVGGYPMEIDRLTNEIPLLENKSFTAPIDFEVTTEITDDKKLLENERKRFFEAQKLAQQKIGELKARNLRDILHIKNQLDAYKTERLARHEKEKDRIEELLEKKKELIDRLDGYVVLETRPVLQNN